MLFERSPNQKQHFCCPRRGLVGFFFNFLHNYEAQIQLLGTSLCPRGSPHPSRQFSPALKELGVLFHSILVLLFQGRY